jgi:hypothetical protein
VGGGAVEEFVDDALCVGEVRFFLPVELAGLLISGLALGALALDFLIRPVDALPKGLDVRSDLLVFEPHFDLRRRDRSVDARAREVAWPVVSPSAIELLLFEWQQVVLKDERQAVFRPDAGIVIEAWLWELHAETVTSKGRSL